MAQILSPGTAAPSFTLRVTPDQSLSSEELREQSLSSLHFTPPIGAQSAVTRWVYTTKCSRCSTNSMPSFSAFLSTVLGVISLMRSIAISTFPFCQISSRKALLRGSTAPIARRRVSANAHFS